MKNQFQISKRFSFTIYFVLMNICFILISCSTNDSEPESVTAAIEVNVEKFIYDTKLNKIRTDINWSATDGGQFNFQYSVFLGHEATSFSSSISNGTGNNTVSLLNHSTPYTIKIEMDVNGTVEREEYKFTTPNLEEFDGLFLDIQTNYVGYTAINFLINGHNTAYNNEVYFNFFDENGFQKPELIKTNFYEPELLISDLQLNLPHSVDNLGNRPNNLEVIVFKNDQLGVKNSFEVINNELRRLPDEDLVALIYNIQDTSVDVKAVNVSNTDIFDTSTNGPEDFKIYLDDVYIGEYQCYNIGSFGSSYIPTINGLIPGNAHRVRVEVDYNNPAINPEYESVFDLTTYKEFGFTTYSTPLSSELDVYLSDITTNSFDLQWRTDLFGLYNCSYDQNNNYDYSFVLELNGEEYTSFDTTQNPIQIVGLEPNTIYSAKLICNYYYTLNGNILETRISEFDVETLQ